LKNKEKRKEFTDCDVDTGVSENNILINKYCIYKYLRDGADRFFLLVFALIRNVRKKNMYIYKKKF
jgi:hypothetical protein